MKLIHGERGVNRTQRAPELVRGVETTTKPLWTEADIDILQNGLEDARGTHTSLYILAILHLVRPGAVSPETRKSFFQAYLDTRIKFELNEWSRQVKRGDQRNISSTATRLLDDFFPALMVEPSAKEKLPQDIIFEETIRSLSDEIAWRNVIRAQAVLFAEDFENIVRPEHWKDLIDALKIHRERQNAYDILNDLVTLRLFSPEQFVKEVTVLPSDKELIREYLKTQKMENDEDMNPEYVRALFFAFLATGAEIKITKQKGVEVQLEPPQFQPSPVLPDRLAI